MIPIQISPQKITPPHYACFSSTSKLAIFFHDRLRRSHFFYHSQQQKSIPIQWTYLNGLGKPWCACAFLKKSRCGTKIGGNKPPTGCMKEVRERGREREEHVWQWGKQEQVKIKLISKNQFENYCQIKSFKKANRNR